MTHSPAHPAFEALAPLFDGGFESLTLDRLNALARAGNPPPCSDTGAAIRFVAATGRVSALEYESRILETGCVATRRGAVHDSLNALCWIAYPQIKRACNALHVAHAKSAHGGRGAARDALTLFDESGVIAVCTDAELGGLLRDRQWRTLFVDLRDRARSGLRFFVCGHALYEKLLAPYDGITGRVLIVDASSEEIASDPATGRAIADAAGARFLRRVESPAAIPPLPLCGIPDWDPRNVSRTFYDDRTVFRAS